MESRLSETFGGGPEVRNPLPAAGNGATIASAPIADDTSGAVLATPEMPEARDDVANGYDDAAESAFLAEARERGELPSSRRTTDDRAPEVEPEALPPLDELVKRIPEDVRETLDELFRARFVRVQRVPARALKR